MSLRARRLTTRPILQALGELAEKAALPDPAAEEDRQGLLIPAAETAGFRMQRALADPTAPCAPASAGKASGFKPVRPARTYFMPSRRGHPLSARTGIALKPYIFSAMVRASSPQFKLSPSGEILDEGDWRVPGCLCLANPLTDVLRTFAPKPLGLLTTAGRDALAKSVAHVLADPPLREGDAQTTRLTAPGTTPNKASCEKYRFPQRRRPSARR